MASHAFTKRCPNLTVTSFFSFLLDHIAAQPVCTTLGAEVNQSRGNMRVPASVSNFVEQLHFTKAEDPARYIRTFEVIIEVTCVLVSRR